MAKVIRAANQPEVKKPVQFFCYQNEYTFSLDKFEMEGGAFKLDQSGKRIPTMLEDANGNNKRHTHESFSFSRVPAKDPITGKTDPMKPLCVLVCEPDDLRFEDKVAYLTKQTKNALSKVVTEEKYRKERNPEAFSATQREATLKTRVQELEEELEMYKELSEKK